jgi:hypothetical protein
MTVRETLIPAAMVPGLVTVEDKDGKQHNVFPIDAKEMLASGEYSLVENGAIEAARMAATPLRSGMAAGIPSDMIVAEISGVEGRIVASEDAEAIKSESAGIDGTGPDKNAAPANARQSDDANAKKSAEQPKTDAQKASESKAGSTTAKTDNK